ncbi:MAG TPA: sugar phosphate nucleotidyltransferase [Solirubrobacteraceae bacterium]
MLAKGVIVASADRTAIKPPLDPRLAAPLVPVANRPILFHALEAMREAGIDEVAIVSCAITSDEIRAAAGDGGRWGLSVTHLLVDRSDGPAGPLHAAQGFVDDDPFILQRGDGLLGDALSSFAPLLDEERPDVVLLVHRQLARRRRAELESRRLLRAANVHLAPGMTGVAGVYLFGAGALRGARDALGTGADGMGLADVVEHVSQNGGRVHVRPVRDWRRYTGDLQDLLEMNRIALEELERQVDETEDGGNRIHGRVAIHPTAHMESSVIRGPVVIGAGARVVDAYIGPYTAIGEGVRVEGAEIEHSIILDRASILHIGGRLEASVVGRDAKVYRDFSLPRALRLQVGDGVEVALA